MADALDSKSSARKGVWVRLPPPVPRRQKGLASMWRKSFFVFEHTHWTNNPVCLGLHKCGSWRELAGQTGFGEYAVVAFIYDGRDLGANLGHCWVCKAVAWPTSLRLVGEWG
mgnify:CR=1 FL=1